MEDKIKVKIFDLTKTIFDGEVEAFTSRNIKGDFDILPDHTNFISVIQEHITLVHHNNQEQIIPIESGILRNLGDKIEVYLGISQVSAAIDLKTPPLQPESNVQSGLAQSVISPEKLEEYQQHILQQNQ